MTSPPPPAGPPSPDAERRGQPADTRQGRRHGPDGPLDLRTLPLRDVEDTAAMAGWGLHVAITDVEIVAAALVRGRQAVELTVTHDQADDQMRRWSATLTGDLDEHGNPLPGARTVEHAAAADQPLAETVARLLHELGRWWPTPADGDVARSELLRLLVLDPARHLAPHLDASSADPWQDLPAPLGELVTWVLRQPVAVLPCPHPQAAEQVHARLQRTGDPTDLPEELDAKLEEAAELAGPGWTWVLLTALWRPQDRAY